MINESFYSNFYFIKNIKLRIDFMSEKNIICFFIKSIEKEFDFIIVEVFFEREKNMSLINKSFYITYSIMIMNKMREKRCKPQSIFLSLLKSI